jgi:5' nucleotidase, deoxy (Pyrimidine), cytosolic type C protein (NT5C)
MTALTTRPIVAFDLDEVLGEFVAPLCHFHNETYGTILTIDDFRSYEFHLVWGGTVEESTTKVQAFFRSPWFQERIEPLAGAMEVLKELKAYFDLVVVTSRQHSISEATKVWVAKHYPGIFDTDIGQPAGGPAILFGNSYGVTGVKKSKSELCRSLGRCCALVDDQEKYCVDVAATLLDRADETSSPAVFLKNAEGKLEPGLVILFGSYRWQSWRVEDNEPPASYSAQLPPQLVHPAPTTPSPVETDAATSGAGCVASAPSADAGTVGRPSGLVRARDWSQVRKLLLSLAGVSA